MRLLAILLSTTLGLSAGEPTEVVLRLLGKAKESKGELESYEELSMSPFVGPNQKKAIGKRWEEIGGWVEFEEVSFSAGSEKVDGDLAAVIACGIGRKGPDDVRLFGFGLRKGETGWKVAPWDGVFDNSGIGFEEARVARAKELEKWIGLERVSQGNEFREAALEEYRKSLRGLVDAKTLKKAKPEEALRHFMKAVSEKKELEMLIWQGVLERSVADDYDWERVMEVAKEGLEGKDERKVWRLLTDSNVIRLEVATDDDDAETSVLMGFIAPYETSLRRQRNQVIRFYLENHGAGWRVKMPTFFSHANENSSAHFNAHQQEMNWRDEEFSSQLTTLFEKENKPRRVESPDELMKLVAKDLGDRSYPQLVRLLYRDPAPKEGDDAEVAEAAGSPDARYQSTAKWWNDIFKKKNEAEFTVAKVKIEGDLALGILKVNLPGEWQSELSPVWMRKVKEGWSFMPNEIDVQDSMAREAEALNEFYAAEEKEMKENSGKDLLLEVGTFVSGKEAPEKGAALAGVKEWRETLKGAKMQLLLAKSGMVEIPEKGSKTFRDLSSGMKGARAGVVEDEIIDSKSEGPFRAVSMMVDGGRGLEMHCPLMIFAETDKGPRVLIDVELWLATNRGKRMRNATALLKLKKELSEADHASLKALFDWHEEVARPVWDAWDEKREEK